MRSEKIIILLVLAGLLILGGALAIPLIRGVRSTQWTPATATITSATVTEDIGTETSGWSVNLRYKFVYQNQTFEGWRFNSMGDFNSGRRADIDQFVATHPIGGTVTTFFNPDNPSDCVLQQGFTENHYIVLMIVLVIGWLLWAALCGRIKIKEPDDQHQPPGPLLAKLHR